MEFYGRTGDLLRRKQSILNLHAELNEWRIKMEANPKDSDAANVFLARARAQLEAGERLRKSAAPLPESAAKGDDTRIAHEITSIRTALPQRKRPRIVTRKLPRVFPHMDYPQEESGKSKSSTTGNAKDGHRKNSKKKENNDKHNVKDAKDTEDAKRPGGSCLCC